MLEAEVEASMAPAAVAEERCWEAEVVLAVLEGQTSSAMAAWAEAEAEVEGLYLLEAWR